MKAQHPGKPQQVLRFVIVGVSNTLIDFLIFNLLVAFTTILPVPASVISYSVGLLNSFIWNRTWTFKHGTRRGLQSEFPRFVVVNLIGLAVNAIVLWAVLWLATSVGVEETLPQFVILNGAKVIALAASMVWNFISMREWVWPHRQAV